MDNATSGITCLGLARRPVIANDYSVSVPIETDDRGFLGRECPECEQYFKLKLGTGLETSSCRCPYCEFDGDISDFATQDQVDYATSIAMGDIQRNLLDPMIRKLDRDIRRSTQNSFISMSLMYKPEKVRIEHYLERDLETDVICSGCSLEFAVFTVFATCPDCGSPNAFDVFDASLEAVAKRLHLSGTVDDHKLKKEILADAVGSAVASFDVLGKRLRGANPDVLPTRPINLFQNLASLCESLDWDLSRGPLGDLDAEERGYMIRMFQVRHLIEHSGGVVDQPCCNNVPGAESLLGHRYTPDRVEIEVWVPVLRRLGASIVTRVRELSER